MYGGDAREAHREHGQEVLRHDWRHLWNTQGTLGLASFWEQSAPELLARLPLDVTRKVDRARE